MSDDDKRFADEPWKKFQSKRKINAGQSGGAQTPEKDVPNDYWNTGAAIHSNDNKDFEGKAEKVYVDPKVHNAVELGILIGTVAGVAVATSGASIAASLAAGALRIVLPSGWNAFGALAGAVWGGAFGKRQDEKDILEEQEALMPDYWRGVESGHMGGAPGYYQNQSTPQNNKESGPQNNKDSGSQNNKESDSFGHDPGNVGKELDYAPKEQGYTSDYGHESAHALGQGAGQGAGSYDVGGGAYGDFGVYSGGIQDALDQMDRDRKQQQEDQKRRDQQKETEKEDEKSDSSDSGDDWDEESEDSSGDTSPGPAPDNGGGNPSSSGYDDGDSGDYFGGPNLRAIRVSKTAKASVYTRYGILLASIGGGEVSSDDQSGWGGTHPNADEGDSGGGVRPGAIGKKKPGERGGGKKKNAKDLLGGYTATDGWTGVHPKVYGILEASVRSGGSGQAPRSAGVTRSAVPNANKNRALQEPGVSLVQGAGDIGQRLRGNRASGR